MRVRLLRLLTLIVVVSATGLLRAQDQTQTQDRAQTKEDQLDIPRSSDPGKQPFIRQFVADEIQIWTSPFKGSSYTSRGFTTYVVPFALITGALIATDQKTGDLLPNTEDQSTWSLRISQIGAPYTLAGMAAAMYLVSRATGDKKARETGFLGAIAIAHSQIVTQGLKLASQRIRPLEYREENHGGTGFFKGGDSFPSGHASGSFALATVFTYEYGRDHKWVPYTAYGLASVVAASRLSAQKHWVSDIFVGGTMGFLVGRFVYKSHHNPALDGVAPKRAERLIPQVGFGSRGLTLSWNLGRLSDAGD